MGWRLAGSLVQLREEINEHWPQRSKNSDGTIGDANHSSRSSDHNPNPKGIVCALDITHDPRNGLDSYKLADAVLASQDPRLKYVISNGRIGSGPRGVKPGVWRKYNGANKHNAHAHFSIDDKYKPDDRSDWAAVGIEAIPAKPDPKAPVAAPYLARGSRGDDVVKLQRLLNIVDDGDFGPKTEAAVRAAQKRLKIVVDGKCGPQTWTALGGYPEGAITAAKKLLKKRKRK